MWLRREAFQHIEYGCCFSFIGAVLLSGVSASVLLESETLEHIFSSNYTTLSSTTLDSADVPSTLCRSSQTQYILKLSESYPNVYRLPHSRIFEEGVRCGEKSASYPDEKLYLDSHMKLVPFSFLQNESIAVQAGIGHMFNKYHDSFRVHIRKVAQDLHELVNQNDLWVGHEATDDRTCAGKVVHNRDTFFLFGRTKDLSGTNVTIGMRHPLTMRTYTLRFAFPPRESITLSFDEKFQESATSFDRTCAARAKADDPEAQEPLRPETQVNSGTDSSCFPANAKVTLFNNSEVPISSLQIGSKVRDAAGSPTDVFMFTHSDNSNKKHSFLEFVMEDGSSLAVSDGHFIETSEGFRPASCVRMGWMLTRATRTPVLVKKIIRKQYRGLFNPQTISGTLLVNGYSVSTYTTTIDPVYAHVMLFPLRCLYRIFERELFALRFLSELFAEGVGTRTLYLKQFLGSTV